MKPYDRIAKYYDLEHDVVIDDLRMYEQFAKDRGGTILIIGVGTGRVALPLLRAGFEVVGVDNSSAMLDIARRKLQSFRSFQVVHDDVADAELDGHFAMVMLPLDTFAGFADPKMQIRVLERCQSLLKPDGLVIIDCMNPLSLPSTEVDGLLRRRFESTMGDRITSAYDTVYIEQASQVLILRITYETVDGGRLSRETVELKLRWVYRFELEALGRIAGLTTTNVYGDYDLGPYEAHSRRLVTTMVRAS